MKSMFVEHIFYLVPLAGGSAPGWEFLPRLLGGAVATLAAVYGTASGVRSIGDWWKIVTTDSVTVDEAIAAGELVQIQGRVHPAQPDDTLISPILDEECVAYEYTISKVVQDSGDSSIDSGMNYRSFIISDGTARTLVDPDEDSLSLNTTTSRTTNESELTERASDERLELDPSAYISDGGVITSPIELREGTLGVDEKVTIVGKANTVPEEATTDADAVIASEEDHLTVMNDDSGSTALRKAARGAFLLILGLVLGVFAVAILQAAILEIV